MPSAQWLPMGMFDSLSKAFAGTMLGLLFLYLIFIDGTSGGVSAQPIPLQVLDPSELGLNADTAFFGAGVAMTPDKSFLLSTGMLRTNAQQFAAIYTRNPQGLFDAIIPPFLGDELLSGSIAVSTQVVAPLCISEDGAWIAIGNRANGFNSSGSILLAMKATGETQYTPQTRLFSNLLPGQSYFPYDMVCSRDMGTIYVTETSVPSATLKFIRLTILTRANSAFVITRVEEYWNGTDVDSAPLALLGNGEMYAVRSSFPQLIYIRRATDGWLFAIVNVSSLAITPTTLALTNGGNRLIVGDRNCNASAGCGYAIDYNADLGEFDIAAATYLFSADVLPAGANQAGFVIAVADGGTSDATVDAGIVVGLPGYLSSLGALASFKPFTDPSLPNNTVWVLGDPLMLPFGPSLSSVQRGGGMLVSHNLLSDDETLVAFGGPGNGGNMTGYVFIVENPMSTISPPFVSPPVAPPVVAPISVPIAVPTAPVAPPTTPLPTISIVAIVFGSLALATLLITIFYLLIQCVRAPSHTVTVNKYK